MPLPDDQATERLDGRAPSGIDPMLGLIHAELQYLRGLAMVRTLAVVALVVIVLIALSE